MHSPKKLRGGLEKKRALDIHGLEKISLHPVLIIRDYLLLSDGRYQS
jgi:hypothetical protein